MAQMLTAKQVSELKGCSYRYIKRIIQEGKLSAVETVNEKNRKTYLVPLDALDEELQHKWYQMMKENPPEDITKLSSFEQENATADTFSEEERKEIDFWIDLVSRWQEYRKMPGVTSMADVDQKFVTFCSLEYPDRRISIDTLYRKWKAVKENDLKGLVDQRGKWRKGKSSIDETVWQAFLYYYLDEAQHPIQKCLEYTKMWAQELRPDLYADIPSYSAFYRKLASVPEGVKVLGREGHKAYNDRCAPYIRRIYDDMASNEWWIADNHTFDVMVKDKDGKLHRPYLTAFLDARSGIFTGFYITYNPSSEATLIALRRGILEYGIPDNIYVDNGREFLTFDIGGLGHRRKKPKKEEESFEVPGVFKRLGINMTNAIVRNAKAKIIERRFRDVKDSLSRLFNTYTGGNVVEKPERLKTVLKKDAIYTDGEFNEYVEAVIKYYFNMMPYNGAVEADKGKAKQDIFNEYLYKKRTASEEDLNLMLMRSGRPQKVGRRGVHLDIAGGRIDYWNDEFVHLMFGKQVYFRYDPDNLSQIRIYDLEDRYLMSVPADNQAVLSYGASKEEVKTAMAKTRRLEKIAEEYKRNAVIAEADRITTMDLVLREAQRNKENYKGKPNPKVLEVQRADEEPAFRKVVGGADLDTMIQSAARRQGGK
jgi:putative transposase